MSFLIIAGTVTLIGLYATAALGLNLQFGVGGMVNFGVAAFFGIGAYAYALVTLPAAAGTYTYVLGLALPWWAGMLIGGLAASLLALIIGAATLRVGGEYLAVVSLALAEMIRQLFVNEANLANGARGLFNIPVPGYDLVRGREHGLFLAGLVLVVLAVSYLVLRRITRSSFGRSLMAVSQNDAVARSLGINVYATKLKGFVIGAFFMGLAGVMFVWYLSILAPTAFSANITFTVFIALIIGGMGSNVGAVVGAGVLLGLREGLTYIKTDAIGPEQLATIQDGLQGLVLILILLFWPRGLVRQRSPKHAVPATASAAPKPTKTMAGATS